MPHGTSLRMGKLGYQSDAQATLAVSYNGLEGYADSLHDALTRPWPAYQNLGVQNPGGDYNQLATSLLQIENEFYGTIRPKRTIASGERPLHALRERGVEYIEVRLMDLNPFVDIGIDANTLHFLDVFLLYCALSDSAPDSPEEIREIGTNQHLTAARGREPGLQLQRQGQPVALRDWAQAILRELQPVAQALDQAQGGTAHADAVAHAERAVQDPDRLPSAQVLRAMAEDHDNVFVGFVRAQSQHTQAALLAEPWSAEQHTRFEAMSAESLAAQRRIEAADTLPFEAFRQHYVSPDRLGLESVA
jgi:glutamate--cysteine ligase